MSDGGNNSSKTKTKTKVCSQCNGQFEKDQFSCRQWKTTADRSCRLCSEYTKLSPDMTRVCSKCRRGLPRTDFDIYQWGRGDDAMCHPCRDSFGEKVLSSIGDPSTNKSKELPDGTCVCFQHSLECCDICMMDFTLMNEFARKRNVVGRELTKDEVDAITEENMKGVRISRKICIMDGQAVCPRQSKKLRCPCNEVTYCSEACQKHHWTIHKMTCKFHAERKQKKQERKQKKQEKARKEVADSLTENQKNVARREAFFAENSGRKGSIEDCAWQLCEHPFVIGGGSIQYGRDGEEFIKGDVAKIFREKMRGVKWDGSLRFGLPLYAPKRDSTDWIAVARRGSTEFDDRLRNHMEELNL